MMVINSNQKLNLLETIFSLAISSDNRWIISGSFAEIRVWDIFQRKITHIFTEAHESNIHYNPYNYQGSIYGLAISSDNRYVVSASADKTIKVWDLKERLNVFVLEEAHQGI